MTARRVGISGCRNCDARFCLRDVLLVGAPESALAGLPDLVLHPQVSSLHSEPERGRSWQYETALRTFVTSTLVGGLFIVVPVYLTVLLLLKGMKAVAGLVRPIAALLPSGYLPRHLLSLLLVLFICFLVGAAVRTEAGQRGSASASRSRSSERIPGYGLMRSLTRRLAGDGDEKCWKPALAEIEDALVPAFVIEEIDDGRLTVFVPSVPTPFAGAVYILDRERVHVVDVPFTRPSGRSLAGARGRGSWWRRCEASQWPRALPSSPLASAVRERRARQNVSPFEPSSVRVAVSQLASRPVALAVPGQEHPRTRSSPEDSMETKAIGRSFDALCIVARSCRSRVALDLVEREGREHREQRLASAPPRSCAGSASTASPWTRRIGFERARSRSRPAVARGARRARARSARGARSRRPRRRDRSGRTSIPVRQATSRRARAMAGAARLEARS